MRGKIIEKKRNDKPDVFIYCTGKTAQIGGGKISSKIIKNLLIYIAL